MTSYTAHVVTSRAQGLGSPKVTVYAEELDVIAAYQFDDNTDDWRDLLLEQGWRTTSPDNTEAEPGLIVVDVAPLDWERITRHITDARADAQAEFDRQDNAWRTIIRDAMHSDASATKIAKVAGVSRVRAYQIRDGRR